MLPMLMLLQDEGLTFRKVLADIPHDVPALVAYILLALFIGGVLMGHRRSSTRSEPRA